MRHRTWRFIVLAAIIFIVLQQGYLRANPAVKNLLIRELQASIAASILNVLMPSERIYVSGGELSGLHGLVNIKNGCEGFEVILILASVTLAYPLRWSWKLAGLLLGSFILYATNLARIVSLYFIAAHRQAWFDIAHGLVWQIIMIGVTMGLFMLTIWLDQRASPSESSVHSPELRGDSSG